MTLATLVQARCLGPSSVYIMAVQSHVAVSDHWPSLWDQFLSLISAAMVQVGTTAVVALVGDRQLYIGNCGAYPSCPHPVSRVCLVQLSTRTGSLFLRGALCIGMQQLLPQTVHHQCVKLFTSA